MNRIVFTGCSWDDEGISRVGTGKNDYLFIFSAAGACSQLIGFLDDSFTPKRAIYVPLSSLSGGEGWSDWLILAGSRGLDLWWHINWAVPLKKRKANVTIGPMLFVELWKLVLFGWKSSQVFIYTSESFKWQLALCRFLYACLCVSVWMHMCRVCSLMYMPAVWGMFACER